MHSLTLTDVLKIGNLGLMGNRWMGMACFLWKAGMETVVEVCVWMYR